MPTSTYLDSFPELDSLFKGADYVDHKTIECTKTLRDFLAGFYSYKPGWMTFLYGVRAIFVRLLGMRQEKMSIPPVTADTLSFTPGAPCNVFTVTHGKEDHYLAVTHEDTHLRADLLVTAEPLGTNRTRFHVVTIVHHNHWTGPVYFTVIRPFHHLVAHFMMRAGAN